LKKFLILSLFLHTALASFFNFKRLFYEPEKITSISVAFIEDKPKKKENNKKEKQKKAKSKKEKVIDKKKEKLVNTKNKKEKKKDPNKKLAEKKKDPNKKLAEKKKEKKFDDMLKDLAEKEIIKKVNDNYDIDKKIKNLSEKKLEEKETLTNKKELLSIINILRNQIDKNWTRPPGIKNINNLSFKIIITLDRNGNVTSINIPQSTNILIKKNSSLKPYLDSAIRAIKKTSPFEGLEKHRYNIWKKNVINFIPPEANR